MKKIPVYIESERGHDTENIGPDKAEEKIKELVDKNMVVTVEKKDGETEIVTKENGTSWSDIFKAPTTETKPKPKSPAFSKPSVPKKEDPLLLDIKGIKSITATHKIKGG